MTYECHITIALHPVSAEALITSLGWKFSCIHGDPDLGIGAREYATRHAAVGTPITQVILEIQRISGILLAQGFPVLREKIELVMYDVYLNKESPNATQSMA